MNKGLVEVWNRVNYLRRYLKVNFNGYYEIGFLQTEGGLDQQEWEWLEDITMVIEMFNGMRKG